MEAQPQRARGLHRGRLPEHDTGDDVLLDLVGAILQVEDVEPHRGPAAGDDECLLQTRIDAPGEGEA